MRSTLVYAILIATVILASAPLAAAEQPAGRFQLYVATNGNGWDLGYPRTVQRPDGKIGTMYYFKDASSKGRYIGATIWSPGQPQAQ